MSVRRPSSRVLVYALAIAVPTLVLLAFGLQSVRRQQQAIAQLETANLRLGADRLAHALAARVAAAAASCLRDPAWAPQARTDDVDPAAVRALRARHAVAQHLVLVADAAVRYPRLAAALGFEDMPPPRDDCGRRVEAAEAEEFAGNVAVALATYRACLGRAPDSETRARILARVARARRRAGDEAGAASAYQALASTHRDDTDRYERPYGLVAALELHDLRPREGAAVLRRARADLVAGRWDVSEEQARYFLDEMHARLGEPLPTGAAAPFLEALDVARAVQASLPLERAAGEGVQAEPLVIGGVRTRVYHALVGGPDAPWRALLVPNRAWIERHLLPDVARDLGLGGGARLIGDQEAPAAGVVASADGALAPWRVWVPAPVPQGASRWLPVALQGAITLLVSVVLGLGVLLLVRDVRRERSVAQMRSQFVSAASHELRTPLAMILLYAQTLLEDVDADREERRGSYEIIAAESERLRHLLDKVLDFARIDAGRRSYRFCAASLHESVEAAVRLLEPQLLRRGFRLHADLAHVADVRHDPEAITGAVLNLLENAAKYSGASRDIELRLVADDETATVSVRDYGIGIPPEDLPHIGEQFFRSRLSTSIGGYGLGLYLVAHAMAAHGGRLDITSAPGQGSTFSLVVPRAGGPAASAPDGEHSAGAFTS